jgi:hypothetical protein
MRWKVNRDLIRWSTHLHGSRLLALSLWSGVIVIDQGNNNNTKRRRKRFVTFYLCRWIMSVAARWRQGGNNRRGGWWGFGHSSVWRCRKRCDVLLAYGRNVATSGKVSLCSFRLDCSCTTT